MTIRTVVEVVADNRFTGIGRRRRKADIGSSEKTRPTYVQIHVTSDPTQCLVDLSTFTAVQGQGDPLTQSVDGSSVPVSVRYVDVTQLQMLFFAAADLVPRPQTTSGHLQSRDNVNIHQLDWQMVSNVPRREFKQEALLCRETACQ